MAMAIIGSPVSSNDVEPVGATGYESMYTCNYDICSSTMSTTPAGTAIMATITAARTSHHNPSPLGCLCNDKNNGGGVTPASATGVTRRATVHAPISTICPVTLCKREHTVDVGGVESRGDL